MTTETTPQSLLDNLLRCERCQNPMVLITDSDPGRQPVYTCNPSTHNRKTHCSAPELKARDLDNFVISQVMDTVLTKENAATLENFTEQFHADQPQELSTDNPREEKKVITRADIITNPQRFVQALGGVKETRDMLAIFIAQITAGSGMLTVHYSLPLPSDSPLVGTRRQQVQLPTEILSS